MWSSGRGFFRLFLAVPSHLSASFLGRVNAHWFFWGRCESCGFFSFCVFVFFLVFTLGEGTVSVVAASSLDFWGSRSHWWTVYRTGGFRFPVLFSLLIFFFGFSREGLNWDLWQERLPSPDSFFCFFLFWQGRPGLKFLAWHLWLETFLAAVYFSFRWWILLLSLVLLRLVLWFSGFHLNFGGGYWSWLGSSDWGTLFPSNNPSLSFFRVRIPFCGWLFNECSRSGWIFWCFLRFQGTMFGQVAPLSTRPAVRSSTFNYDSHLPACGSDDIGDWRETLPLKTDE